MAMFATPADLPQQGIMWQWMGDGGMWHYYDPSASAHIECSFITGAPCAIVRSSTGGLARTGATYDIRFDTMTQVNTASKFTRNVRREVDPFQTCTENWSWANGTMWEALPAWVSFQIVACREHRREQSTAAHVNGVAYTFFPRRFVAMEQRTGARRQMQLRAQVAPSQIAGAPAPAAAAASSSSVNCNSPGDLQCQQILSGAKDCTANAAADETCAVCIDGFSPQRPALLLSRCNGHYMHGECITQTFKAMGPKCPTCSHMYGLLYGDQPSGTMTYSTHPRGRMSLPGYKSVGRITIAYNIPGGVQGPKHPNPGQQYRGTCRAAYLPDNPEGREVLALLQKCFDQRMTFTVGTSLTTGRSNSVVWNGVHHKTNTSGGPTMYGYPDSNYLDRVKAELAAKGIR